MFQNLFLLGVSGLVGAYLGKKLFRRQIVIEFKISFFERFLYALIMDIIITMAIMLEIIFSELIISYCNLVNLQTLPIRYFIDNGFLIVIITPILSILFGKIINDFRIDLSDKYSVNIVKFYYSIIVITNCVGLWVLVHMNPDYNKHDVQCIYGRIFIWSMNVIGTWACVGINCEGRINREIRNIVYSRKKGKTVQEWIEIVVPYILVILINCFMICSIQFKRIFELISIAAYAVLIGMLISVWVLRFIEYPSNKRSNRKLSKAINRIKNENRIDERYETVKYTLENNGSKKYIVIHEIDIKWLNHEKELKEYFGEEKITVEEFNYEECKKQLTNVKNKRTEYIRNGYIFCENDAIHRLLKESMNSSIL